MKILAFLLLTLSPTWSAPLTEKTDLELPTKGIYDHTKNEDGVHNHIGDGDQAYNHIKDEDGVHNHIEDEDGVYNYTEDEDGVHNHSDRFRDGRDDNLKNIKFKFGDISVSGNVEGDKVSVGSRVNIQLGADHQHSSKPPEDVGGDHQHSSKPPEEVGGDHQHSSKPPEDVGVDHQHSSKLPEDVRGDQVSISSSVNIQLADENEHSEELDSSKLPGDADRDQVSVGSAVNIEDGAEHIHSAKARVLGVEPPQFSPPRYTVVDIKEGKHWGTCRYLETRCQRDGPPPACTCTWGSCFRTCSGGKKNSSACMYLCYLLFSDFEWGLPKQTNNIHPLLNVAARPLPSKQGALTTCHSEGNCRGASTESRKCNANSCLTGLSDLVGNGACRGGGWNSLPSASFPRKIGYVSKSECEEICRSTRECSAYDIARQREDKKWDCHHFGHQDIIADTDIEGTCYKMRAKYTMSGIGCSVQEKVAEIGTNLWADKSSEITQIPPELEGTTLLQADEDEGKLGFILQWRQPAVAYVALHQNRDGGLALGEWTLKNGLSVEWDGWAGANEDIEKKLHKVYSKFMKADEDVYVMRNLKKIRNVLTFAAFIKELPVCRNDVVLTEDCYCKKGHDGQFCTKDHVCTKHGECNLGLGPTLVP